MIKETYDLLKKELEKLKSDEIIKGYEIMSVEKNDNRR